MFKKEIDLMQQYLASNNALSLKRLSNEIASEALLKKDKSLVYFSYLPYIIYKILVQPHLRHSPNWRKNRKLILSYLEKLEKSKNIEKDIISFKDIFGNKDFEMYNYIKNIFSKAKLKKAAFFYDHGLSVNRCIDLTDADRFELLQYVKNNKINRELAKDDIAFRLDYIKDAKNIVFDSSSLIALTQTNLLHYLELFKKKKKLSFFIPFAVYKESVLSGEEKIRFGWSSEQIKHYIDKGVFKLYKLSPEEEEHYRSFYNIANSIFYTKYGNIEILQEGELEALVLLSRFKKALFCIDELITRKIIEAPMLLKEVLDKRYKTKVFLDKKKLLYFSKKIKGIKVIRSIDIISYLYENNFFKEYGKDEDHHLIRSLLYALKQNGASIRYEAIEKHISSLR